MNNIDKYLLNRISDVESEASKSSNYLHAQSLMKLLEKLVNKLIDNTSFALVTSQILMLTCTEDSEVYLGLVKHNYKLRQNPSIVIADKTDKIMNHLYDTSLMKLAIPKTDRYVVLLVRDNHRNTGIRRLTNRDVALAAKRARIAYHHFPKNN